jgi:hypothetical protein
MKKIIFAAAFLLLAGAGRAEAQWFSETPSTTANVSTITGGIIARSWASSLPKSYGVAILEGDAHFSPSTFLSYDDAVKLGESDSRSASSSLGEMARLAQERKNAETQKARVVFEQDVTGKIQPNRAEN